MPLIVLHKLLSAYLWCITVLGIPVVLTHTMHRIKHKVRIRGNLHQQETLNYSWVAAKENSVCLDFCYFLSKKHTVFDYDLLYLRYIHVELVDTNIWQNIRPPFYTYGERVGEMPKEEKGIVLHLGVLCMFGLLKERAFCVRAARDSSTVGCKWVVLKLVGCVKSYLWLL